MGSGIVKNFKPKYKKGDVNNYSINKCLVELGAPVEEVYYSLEVVPYRMHPKRYGKVRAYRSIYSRYSKDDLWNWAQYLYKQKVKEIHPDKHKVYKKAYEEYFKYIQQVFKKAESILNPKKSYFGRR